MSGEAREMLFFNHVMKVINDKELLPMLDNPEFNYENDQRFDL